MMAGKSYAKSLVEDLGLKEPQTVLAAEILIGYLLVFDQKQHDYGPGNIARFGEQGILVRSSDKLERLINLADRGEDPSVAGEAVDDTWQDLMGYALIAQLVRRGMWLSSQTMKETITDMLGKVTATAHEKEYLWQELDVLSPDGELPATHWKGDSCPGGHKGVGGTDDNLWNTLSKDG